MIVPVGFGVAVLLAATGPLATWPSFIWRALSAVVPEFAYEEGELEGPEHWPRIARPQ